MLDFSKIDKSWTLFLDRDGVINREKYLDFVLNYNEFVFDEDVLPSLKKLAERFGRLILVTNQRGVEKKLMTEEDLTNIHIEMLRDIEAHGGRIDAVFYCTSLDDHHPNRKPQAGMAMIARESYPEIEFSKSIMVGNNLSDMMFGRNAGMYTVFVQTTNPNITLPHPAIDKAFVNLKAFTEELMMNDE